MQNLDIIPVLEFEDLEFRKLSIFEPDNEIIVYALNDSLNFCEQLSSGSTDQNFGPCLHLLPYLNMVNSKM